MYDFRDGILLEKVVYKDTSCNCGYVLLYLLCLLITWIWGCGWFALFFYSYIFHEKVTFIVFLCIWGVFIIILVVVGILTIQKSKNEKRRKKAEKEDREQQLKLIAEAKRKRIAGNKNNVFEINTNIDNDHDNKGKIDNESERRPVISTENNVDENKI